MGRGMMLGDLCWNAARCCLIAAWLVLAGCGSQAKLPGPQPHPVHGKVIYQGKPAAGFRVSFNLVAEREGPRFSPTALTNESGEFQLRSYHENDGAPAGDYVVTFAWPQAAVREGDPDDGPALADRLKGRYDDPRKLQFKVTVHEGDNALEPFELK
jgi:hypothetical protein